MANEERITRAKLIELKDKGITSTKQIAEILGVSPGSVRNAKRRHGMTEKQLKHDIAFPWPWPLTESQHSKTPRHYLLVLDTVRQGQGGKIKGDRVRYAFDWAKGLIDRDRDIFPPKGGDDWEEVPAQPVEGEPKSWHIRFLYEEAMREYIGDGTHNGN